MIKKTVLLLLLLIALSAAGLVGCGGKDEVPEAGNTTQKTAMVPDSVVQSETRQIPAVEDESEAAAEPQEAPAEHPTAPAAAAAAPSAETEPPAEVSPPRSQPVSPAGNGNFSLQLGSYTVVRFAEEKAAQLRDLGHPATVEEAEVGGQMYHRVFIRGLADHQSAEKLGEELHSSLGLSYLIRRK